MNESLVERANEVRAIYLPEETSVNGVLDAPLKAASGRFVYSALMPPPLPSDS